MKRANFFGAAFSLPCVLFLFGTTVSAQSTDPDNPTVVSQNVVQWNNPGIGETTVFYYTFTPGPGVLKVTTDQKSNGITGNSKLSWELMDANFKELESEDFYQVTTSERRVNDIKLLRKQKVILKVKVDEEVVNFKFQFAGAVNFIPVKSSESEGIQDITGDNTLAQQQICMPRNGVLILTMADGKKVRVDLKKVQKITVQ